MTTGTATMTMERQARLAADWEGIAAGLTEALANFTLKGLADGGVSGIVSLVKAATSLRLEETTEARAWRVAALSFAWAVGRVHDETQISRDGLSHALKRALEAAKLSIDNGQAPIGRLFLERPTTLNLYKEMKSSIISDRGSVIPGSTASDELLSTKLDIAFNQGVFEVWSRKPDYFRTLADALQSPGVEAVENDLSWQAYRETLKYQFQVQPVFGQDASSISLSQIYVPLRAYWKNEDDKDYNYRGAMRIPSSATFIMLDNAIDDWIESDNNDDWLRLVGGGPGSGKSTTLRALASRLADRQEWRPLFVPLQHVGITGDLRESVNKHFTDGTGGSFVRPPLSRASVEDGPPLLIIFDGLDELIAPNEAANDVIATFTARLTTLIAALRGDGLQKLKVVVSGRLPAFQFAKRFISPPDHGCLEVYGYTRVTRHNEEEGNALWDIDQRDEWWTKYALATGGDTATPPALSAETLKGITHEPLLCYLLVLAGYATKDWEKAAENPNLIYSTLMQNIYERGWGDGLQKRHGPGKSMKLAEFLLLMETIGLAAWLGGDTRVASDASFTRALKIMNAEKEWSLFNQDNGSDVTNLAMNFYLKAAEGANRGFEFTHKSFGEYLAAKSLLKISGDIYDLAFRRIDLAMSEWSEASGTGVITHEILIFMRNQVRIDLIGLKKAEVKELVKKKKAFELIAQESIAAGFPANLGSNWRIQAIFQRNAELACWAVINCFSLGLASIGNVNDARVNINWSNRYELRELLVRQTGPEGWSSTFPACLSWVDARDQTFHTLSLYNIDLQYSDLKGASFDSCTIVDSNFYGAELSRASFARTFLIGTVFDRARFHLTNLSGAAVREITFEDSFVTNVIVNADTLVLSSDDAFDQIDDKLFLHLHVDDDDNDSDFSIERMERVNQKLAKLKRLTLKDFRQ
jgi:uncharacterized protein YjbI with pentapeptide repeats